MLYLGIDQHARQITISLRDENGDVLEARQVSTKPEKIHDFFQRLTAEWLNAGEKFVAVLEVCGFNEWLIRMLRDYRCEKVILIQPEQRTKRKTDRRDAAALSELLWVNRKRLLEGKAIRGLAVGYFQILGGRLPMNRPASKSSAACGYKMSGLECRAWNQLAQKHRRGKGGSSESGAPR